MYVCMYVCMYGLNALWIWNNIRVRKENNSLEDTLQVGVGRLQHMHLQLDELREQQSEGRALTQAEDFFKYKYFTYTYIHTYIHFKYGVLDLVDRVQQFYALRTGTPHTYIHSFIHTYIPFIHTYIHTHECIHACPHTIHTYSIYINFFQTHKKCVYIQ